MSFLLSSAGAASEELTRVVHDEWAAAANRAGVDLAGFDPAAPLAERIAWAGSVGFDVATVYRTFPKEEDVVGLRVDEAYDRRERRKTGKQTQEPGKNTANKKDAKMLRKSIGNLSRRTGSVVHSAAYAEPQDAVRLIPAVRKAISELEDLLHFLEEQAAKAPADGQNQDPPSPQAGSS